MQFAVIRTVIRPALLLLANETVRKSGTGRTTPMEVVSD